MVAAVVYRGLLEESQFHMSRLNKTLLRVRLYFNSTPHETLLANITTPGWPVRKITPGKCTPPVVRCAVGKVKISKEDTLFRCAIKCKLDGENATHASNLHLHNLLAVIKFDAEVMECD